VNEAAGPLGTGPRELARPLLRRWMPWLTLPTLAGLIGVQAFAYASRLSLSLGPRVILEPWLLRRGYLLYEEIADLHSPLLSLLLSVLIPLFPDGLSMARTVLVVIISLSTLLTFLAGRRAGGWLGGLWAAGFLIVWSPVFGFGKLWHEALLTPLYTLILLSYDPTTTRRSVRSLLWIGFLGGIGLMIKQHAIVVLAVLVGWNAFAGWRRGRPLGDILRDTLLIGAAALLPLLAFLAYQLLRAGTLHGFLYWTLGYNLAGPYRTMAALRPTRDQLGVLASAALLLPAAALLGIARARQDEGLRLGWGFVLLAASAATAYPRFHFFHLQPALPVVAWLSTWVLASALRVPGSVRTLAAGIAVALPLLWALTAGASYGALLDPKPQYVYEYSDLVPVAEQVMQHKAPEERIFIFPDDEATANLYYLTGTLPPTPWIFTYPWYMMDWVQDRILDHLQTQPPDWIVYFPERWDIEQQAPRITDYISSHYRRDISLEWAQGRGWLLERVD
jgi:hypothetical protein